jgi:hypothetical protein
MSSGSDPARAVGPRSPFGPVLVAGWVVGIAALALVLFYGTGGDDLGYRSVGEFAAKVPIRQGCQRVRFELQNGSIGIATPVDADAPPLVDYWGGVRRAADDAATLARIEQVPVEFVVVDDLAHPDTLVLRGPSLPEGSSGLLALEISVRLPASIAVEVAIRSIGHVTIADRTAPITIDTGRGDLRFERCSAAVTANTGRGNFIAFDHRGDLRGTTAVGDMQAFLKATGSALELVTGRGTVQCGVPADCEFELDARAVEGRIGADFGLESERVGEFGAALVGARGSGRTKVLLRTGKGHLAFRVK